MITREQINAINKYFDKKGVDRKQLEKLLDFDKLTMESKYAHDILRMLQSGKEIEALEKDEEDENVIKSYVCFIRNRSGSGQITWDEFVKRLNDLYLPNSEFGIRVQRFSKYSYWEVFFNHFEIVKYKDGDAKLTFNHTHYPDEEHDNAYGVLSANNIDTDMETSKVFAQIADKWERLSKDDKDDVVSAIGTIYATQYVDKSKVDIIKNMVEKITMSNADLVPEVGLRDYTITFTGGDMIGLGF